MTKYSVQEFPVTHLFCCHRTVKKSQTQK